MKTELILIGKTTDRHFQAGIDDYASRIGHYMPFHITVLPDVKRVKGLTEQMVKSREADQILALLTPADHVVLLDERGKQRRSVDYANWLQQKQLIGKRLVYIIGGPYGFDERVYSRADEMISLSLMTFSHQMVRLIFTEQLYRACTILRGEPYHHE